MGKLEFEAITMSKIVLFAANYLIVNDIVRV